MIAILLALAATARHAIAGFGVALPDLIVGHGNDGGEILLPGSRRAFPPSYDGAANGKL